MSMYKHLKSSSYLKLKDDEEKHKKPKTVVSIEEKVKKQHIAINKAQRVLHKALLGLDKARGNMRKANDRVDKAKGKVVVQTEKLEIIIHQYNSGQP